MPGLKITAAVGVQKSAGFCAECHIQSWCYYDRAPKPGFLAPPTGVRKYNTMLSCFYTESLSFPRKETCLLLVVWFVFVS